MPSLNEYYTQYLNDLGSQYKVQMDTETQNYNASKKNLDSSYNRSAGQLGTVREQAMRDAYVSQQKAMRDMPVTLAAQGIRGGMTESTYGNLLKTYQNSRNAATTSYNQQYGDLTQNYQNNMTELENAYRKNISDIKAAQNADAWARANDSWAAYLQEQAEKRAQEQWDMEKQKKTGRSSGGGGGSTGNSGTMTEYQKRSAMEAADKAAGRDPYAWQKRYYLNATGKWYRTQAEAREALKKAGKSPYGKQKK